MPGVGQHVPPRVFFDQKQEEFFFEKKNQKTFAILGARWIGRATQWIKVFWFFFSKKNFSCF